MTDISLFLFCAGIMLMGPLALVSGSLLLTGCSTYRQWIEDIAPSPEVKVMLSVIFSIVGLWSVPAASTLFDSAFLDRQACVVISFFNVFALILVLIFNRPIRKPSYMHPILYMLLINVLFIM